MQTSTNRLVEFPLPYIYWTTSLAAFNFLIHLLWNCPWNEKISQMWKNGKNHVFTFFEWDESHIGEPFLDEVSRAWALTPSIQVVSTTWAMFFIPATSECNKFKQIMLQYVGFESPHNLKVPPPTCIHVAAKYHSLVPTTSQNSKAKSQRQPLRWL